MLPRGVKTLANYIEEAGYETAYVGKWHLASNGALYGKKDVDHTVTAIPLEYRGGYTGYWRAADVLEFTSHGYDGYVFDENNRRVDFKGYRADCIADMALEYLDGYAGDKPFFLTISQIEPHHQNDRHHYEGPGRLEGAVCALRAARRSGGAARRLPRGISGLSGAVRVAGRKPRAADRQAEGKGALRRHGDHIRVRSRLALQDAQP